MAEKKNNNASLEDLGGSNAIDLTKGKVEPKTQEEHVQATEYKPDGPVDVSEMKPINAADFLPEKKQEVNPLEESLFADLDAAVEREKKSITERIDAITEAQKEEFEAKADEIETKNLDDAIDMRDESKVEEDQDKSGSFFTEDDDKSIDEELGLTDEDEVSDDEDKLAEHVSAFAEDEPVNRTAAPVEEDKAEEDSDPIVAHVVTTEKDILDTKEDVFADDEEFKEDENGDKRNTDELIEELKTEVKAKIMPKRDALDLSKFTVSKKSISYSKAMKLASETRQSVADWALVGAGRPISMTGLSGPEILKLNPENSGRNRLNTFKDIYRVMYDHIFDANKPEFETWLKQTRFVDLNHIYFALYMATFNGSNYVNFSCPHCEKVFIKDIKFEDMVVYADDATKEKVRNILRMDSTTADAENYDVDLFQISDSYVFGLKTPSIWNVIIETASLSDTFIEKHADLIDLVSYIDTIYIIDKANSELIPIDTKPDKNDQAKTSARRIKAFYDIISKLSTEDYYTLRSKITSYDSDAEKVSYQIPACTCPECATEIPANTDMSPDTMLFTRHQLSAIGNM